MSCMLFRGTDGSFDCCSVCDGRGGRMTISQEQPVWFACTHTRTHTHTPPGRTQNPTLDFLHFSANENSEKCCICIKGRIPKQLFKEDPWVPIPGCDGGRLQRISSQVSRLWYAKPFPAGTGRVSNSPPFAACLASTFWGPSPLPFEGYLCY